MKKLLKQNFGYDEFRPLQKEIIENILEKKDTFVLMPTGSGKSICYQLPSLIMDGISLVISPLIALMKDQVDALKANGIPASAITSSIDYEEIESIKNDAQNNRLKILYIAPERLATDSFRDFLKTLNLSLLAIDEAHCISEWGHDFRPEYRNIKKLRDDFPNLPIIALTATATEKVKTDICEQLQLKNPEIYISSFNRENLNYQIIPKNDSFKILQKILKTKTDHSTIIYCFSRKGCEKLSTQLKKSGYKSSAYHAGMASSKRTKIQENFIKDKIQIIVATIAFGMGINKPDVRLVVHYDLPKTIENYYQETGRAGRDGLPSQCILFYSYGDKIKQDFFINQISDKKEKENAKNKLEKVIEFAELTSCRRKFLLNYFGEKEKVEQCKNCDNCTEEKNIFNATEISQKILSTIIKTGNCFGITHIIGVLKGSKAQKIIDRNHNKLSVYGIAKEQTDTELRAIINSLIENKILIKSTGEYPILTITKKGFEFLKNRNEITLQRSQRQIKATKSKKKGRTGIINDKLFQNLRALRRKIADEKSIAPFMVFGDVSLKEMCKFKPKNLIEFLEINGVGEKKLSQYGELFIKTIEEFDSTISTQTI